jgi:ABC-2 type transport system permease protein
MKPLMAQLRAEISMTLRRGESVLLALGIPVLLLVFFSAVDVLPTDTDRPVDFLAPGMLALAVLSAAFTGPAIATAFERQYGVLKRIGTTPLGRGRLLVAKILSIAAVEVLQVAVLIAIAAAFGWRPDAAGLPAVVGATLLATAAFCGLALLLAGTQRAELVLAGANGLHIVLLLLSGMMIPLGRLPGPVRSVAQLLPSTAVAEIFRGALDSSASVPNRAWLVLIASAVVAPVLAAWRFQWE